MSCMSSRLPSSALSFDVSMFFVGDDRDDRCRKAEALAVMCSALSGRASALETNIHRCWMFGCL